MCDDHIEFKGAVNLKILKLRIGLLFLKYCKIWDVSNKQKKFQSIEARRRLPDLSDFYIVGWKKVKIVPVFQIQTRKEI